MAVVEKKVFVPGFRTLIFSPALYIRERVERGGERKIKFRRLSISSFLEELGGNTGEGKRRIN